MLEGEARWLLQGVKLLGQDDAGTLESAEGGSHSVDSKRWAWESAGAVLVRLVQSDVGDLDASERTQVMRETAQYCPPVS
ncbi:hypothetical protein AVDCRST_MAG94-5506 [uncultured Leptolyngbya sp.]|uniref:Uncharacterized protein n=1 Tax=uncultured Leptolyngbya sp. TaxID=332963 RepID=A0A6J4NNN1_9CYAN|nr:hypothetical protein AVDCRST_MAG94-5506 [uncultured Leptolyngbya sp.]